MSTPLNKDHAQSGLILRDILSQTHRWPLLTYSVNIFLLLLLIKLFFSRFILSCLHSHTHTHTDINFLLILSGANDSHQVWPRLWS